MSSTTPTMVGELGEAGILSVLQRSYSSKLQGNGIIGIGDDAAVIAAPDAKFAIATDAMNQNHHFMLTWPSGIQDNGYSTGWKLAAQNLSDMNAMGGTTSALSISLAMPKTTPINWVKNFGRGIANACYYLGAAQTVISGGDLTRADTIATAITATANLTGKPVLREAPHKVDGYLLAHFGNAGLAAAGLTVATMQRATALSRAEIRALRGFLRPRPPLTAGPQVSSIVTALMDVSDSILTDADRIATANGLYAHIDEHWIQHKAKELSEVAEQHGVDPRQWVLTGGEDYGLLAVVHPEQQLPTGWEHLGKLTTTPQPRPERTGWDHF